MKPAVDYGKLADEEKWWNLLNHPEGDLFAAEQFCANDIHQADALFCTLVTRRKKTQRQEYLQRKEWTASK